MISTLHSHKSLLWALCIVLLIVRFGGAHWHLCFDGSEEPRAVHVGDVANDHKTEPGHTDTDLNLVESGLAKYFKSIDNLPALLLAVALICLLPTRRQGASAAFFESPPPLLIHYRLPSPRAPPR